MERDECRGEGCRGDFDSGVCVDVAMRRSWMPVEEPVQPSEHEREYELVRGPDCEDADARNGERGSWDA